MAGQTRGKLVSGEPTVYKERVTGRGGGEGPRGGCLPPAPLRRVFGGVALLIKKKARWGEPFLNPDSLPGG